MCVYALCVCAVCMHYEYVLCVCAVCMCCVLCMQLARIDSLLKGPEAGRIATANRALLDTQTIGSASEQTATIHHNGVCVELRVVLSVCVQVV